MSKADAGAQAPKWPGSMMRPLVEIVPYENNPRTHPPDQIRMLAAILLKYGPDQPIVVDEEGVILKGHGRLAAAREAGLAKYPVLERAGLTEAQKSEIRIHDNQIALLSGWDTELLRIEFELLREEGVELSTLGFSEVFVEEVLAGGPQSPDEFQRIAQNFPTNFCCPECGYKWSGNPLAGEKRAEAEKAAKPPAKKKGKAK